VTADAALAVQHLAAFTGLHAGAKALLADLLDAADLSRVVHVRLSLSQLNSLASSIEPRMIPPVGPPAKAPAISATLIKPTSSAAAALNLTIIEFSSKNLTHLQTELEQRSHSGDIGFDAVLLIPESLSTTKAAFQTIANFTRDQKIPVGGSRIVTDDYGTLFAVTVNNTEIGIQAAHLADKVFRGIPAGTIPVVSPETHIVINIKVAQELGINVSEGLLVRADEVIH